MIKVKVKFSLCFTNYIMKTYLLLN
jgi:hypothetical protein